MSDLAGVMAVGGLEVGMAVVAVGLVHYRSDARIVDYMLRSQNQWRARVRLQPLERRAMERRWRLACLVVGSGVAVVALLILIVSVL